MEGFIKSFLNSKGYHVNDKAQVIIKECSDWYSNNRMDDFHKRVTVQGTQYELLRLNFAKRCCSDDANLCEIVEVNGGKNKAQHEFLQGVLRVNKFVAMYRKQLEKMAATGTVGCYVRLDDAVFLTDGKIRGGKIKLNYVYASNIIPLTVENGEVTEAAFVGTALKSGKVRTTLVDFVKDSTGNYISETNVFDELGNRMTELTTAVQPGEVKPFSILMSADVNNIEHMEGYGYPKLRNAIPVLKALDLCYNVLYGDLDKGDKLVLINELLCKFDDAGNPITPNEQMKKTFVMMGGEKRPGEGSDFVKEINPVIRIDDLTKSFELNLSLLSMMFGYGTKRYTFENGQIKTATEYAGERQDCMQELNKQRSAAEDYIKEICHAVLWFSNTFHGTTWNVDEEIMIDFDDSYVTDRQSELEGKRADALSFQEIPKLTIWYLMDRYNLSEDEAVKIYQEGQYDMDFGDDTED